MAFGFVSLEAFVLPLQAPLVAPLREPLAASLAGLLTSSSSWSIWSWSLLFSDSSFTTRACRREASLSFSSISSLWLRMVVRRELSSSSSIDSG